MLSKILKGTTALTCAVAITFGAVGTSWAGSMPAPTDSAAGSYQFPDFNDFQLQMDRGFDETGVLRPDGTPSYLTVYMVKQVSDRCAEDIKAGVSGAQGVALKMALKMGFFEVIGTVLGTFIGYPGAGRAIGEIAGPTVGAVLGGGYASGDEEVKELLSAAHAYCVIERVQKNRAAFVGNEQPLWDAVIVPALRMHSKVNSLPPGASSPDDQPPSASAGTHAPSGHDQAQFIPPPPPPIY